MADINLNNLDGIPFGNNAGRPANPVVGQPYFNGEASRLELYTANGWQNITQETPSVVSITGQGKQSTTSTITINGTNFAAGANVFVVGTNGIEVPANSVTLESVVQITAVLPALDPAYEPYDVKVVNTSNLYGILYETLNVDASPIWTTGSGSLGTYIEQSAMSVQVSATDVSDPTSSPLIYSISSGALPTGLSISSSTGVISGTPANVSSQTTYNFTANAYDGQNNVTRNFSITITDRAPVWVTAATLPIFTKNVAYSTTLSATNDDAAAISYSLFSGSLPTGLTLNSSTGVISGTPSNTTSATFTIRATDSTSLTYADRQFTISNIGSNAPVWVTSGTISGMTGGVAYSYQLSATDDSGSAPTYSLGSGTLPTGITLSSSGLISGTPSNLSAGTLSFTFNAADANGTFTTSGTISVPTIPYIFTSHTFTNAGVTGASGPSLAQIRSAYSAASWTQNSSYLDMSVNGVQRWTVPTTGSYRIAAAGAGTVQGQWNINNSPSTTIAQGITMQGDFSLTAGSVLNIVVGQKGITGSQSSSGGGGSFVYNLSPSFSMLIAAGGAGGTGLRSTGGGVNATTSTSGTSGGGGAAGGSSGSGGAAGVGSYSGGGGAGFNGNGADAASAYPGFGGKGYVSNWIGGTASNTSNFGGDGGFGGGGASGAEGGGGGGGYSGGGGGSGSPTSYGGGGGGSYNAGSNQSNGTLNSNMGYVTITKL